MLDANFPALLQSFFTTRLMAQRKVSSHTIASYRDTFRLLLRFAGQRLHKAPSALALADLDPAGLRRLWRGVPVSGVRPGRAHQLVPVAAVRVSACRSYIQGVYTDA